jgi:hypothetical protein
MSKHKQTAAGALNLAAFSETSDVEALIDRLRDNKKLELARRVIEFIDQLKRALADDALRARPPLRLVEDEGRQ